MVQRMESTFIYRLKLEPEEEVAKMSASGMARDLNLTYYSPLGVELSLKYYFCFYNMM